jgi:hypothetical protein
MIDTISLWTQNFAMSRDPHLERIPARVDARTGEELGADKLVHNNERVQVTVTPSGDGNRCRVQFSAPTLVKGRVGFEGPTASEWQAMPEMVEEELRSIGIMLRVRETPVTRIDLFRNLRLRHSFGVYAEVFRRLPLRSLKRQEYESTIMFSNSDQSILLYDKHAEMERKKLPILPPKGTFRAELQLKTGRKVESVLGTRKLGEIELGFAEDAYVRYLKSQVFRIDVEPIELVPGEELKGQLTSFKTRYRTKARTRYLQAVGLDVLQRGSSPSKVIEALVETTESASGRARARRELVHFQSDVMMLQKYGRLTLADVYPELKGATLGID